MALSRRGHSDDVEHEDSRTRWWMGPGTVWLQDTLELVLGIRPAEVFSGILLVVVWRPLLGRIKKYQRLCGWSGLSFDKQGCVWSEGVVFSF